MGTAEIIIGISVVLALSLWIAVSERSRRRLRANQENILRAACRVRNTVLRTRLAILDRGGTDFDEREGRAWDPTADIAEMLGELQRHVEAELEASQTLAERGHR